MGMFNLHPPTTPPKQSAASQSSRAAGVAGSNPAQYTPTTSGSSHRSATSLARLQQLTWGLENTPGVWGSDPSGASAVPTSGNPTGNSIPGAKPSKQNSALLAPSYYPGQQPGQPQTPVGHHSNTPGVFEPMEYVSPGCSGCPPPAVSLSSCSPPSSHPFRCPGFKPCGGTSPPCPPNVPGVPRITWL